MLGKTTLISHTNVEDNTIIILSLPVLLKTNNAIAALMAGSITLIIGIRLVSIKYAAILIKLRFFSFNAKAEKMMSQTMIGNAMAVKSAKLSFNR